jgi:spermidine synthase
LLDAAAESFPSAEHAQRRRSAVLKACIFATGLSGIVAEYVMSTLASYLLGNAVLQWTLTVSIMLFAMGVGSRASRHVREHLLEFFVATELALSLLCAVSSTGVYLLSAYVESIAPAVYTLSFGIGLLIGLEIPIAARLNDAYEVFRVNISSVMEKDYYGALLGGLLFAFVALPYLGLTYTPILLGAVNLAVAAGLFWQCRSAARHRRWLTGGFVGVPVLLVALAAAARPIMLYGEQRKYRDTIVYREQTPYQRIVVTRWKDDYWLYLNGNEQFSSYDEERYHEPLVHPAMAVSASRRTVLILGGGDGLAAREVLKYPEVESLTLVDLDPAVTRLARTHPVFVALNGGALDDPRVRVINQDAYRFLRQDASRYDVMLVDLPDPKTVGLARLYTEQFYRLAGRHLAAGGALVTQATSPFFSREAFLSILKTVTASGLSAVAYRNNVPTLGEWGWVIGTNAPWSPAEFRKRLLALEFDDVETRFLNRDAMQSMFHFGKGVLERLPEIRVNDELDLALYRYYEGGAWDVY